MKKDQRYSSQQNNMGNVPPQNREIEQTVLGAILLEGHNAYYQIVNIINPSVFYDNRHSTIFEGIKILIAEGIPIDLYTVTDRLKRLKKLTSVGGAAYLAELTQGIGSGAHIISHARIIYELWVMRSMAEYFSTLTAKCYDGNFDELNGEYQRTLISIDSMFAGSGAEKHISQILLQHGRLIEERIKRANDGKMQGVTYGLDELDKATRGAEGGELNIIAARPGMGKTAVALHIAKSAALDSNAVTIASLEMTDLTLADRLISSYSGVDGGKLRSGRMDTQDLYAYEVANNELRKLNISIDDTAGTTLGRISAMARTKHRKGDLDMLIIDYLQLITPEMSKYERQNRDQQVGIITKGLKQLAKELKIPIILLCQLNRDIEKRTFPEPVLSDLRESGSIEQDADTVLMLMRPSYYGFDVDKDGNSVKGIGYIYIRKQREGATGVVSFRYSEDMSRISNVDFGGEHYNNEELAF